LLQGSSGALTGGLTLAVEALVTGGLGSLTADAIAGSVIGGGVGAGVNDELGGGQIAHVLSGIAGGAAARGAISKYRQRQARQQQNAEEMLPLLGGQRLGGRGRVRSNLIPSQSEQDVDTSFRPQQERQPQETIFDKVKKISARKAREATRQMQQLGNRISEGASNIRQRIT
jgi:hypothetical protein